MSDANKALAEVRGWLCDNLSSGDAGKVCGMLSAVSRRINKADELEVENEELREQCKELYSNMTWLYEHRMSWGVQINVDEMEKAKSRMRELGIEVTENE